MDTTILSRFLMWGKIVAGLCLVISLQTGATQSTQSLKEHSSRLRVGYDSNDDDSDAYQHSIGDCYFETQECSYLEENNEGTCGWKWHWDRQHVDHTYNHTDGALLSLSGLPSSQGQHGCASSPQLPPTDGRALCLTFWFQLTGNLVQSLRVVASRDHGLTVGTKVLWALSVDQGEGWKFGRTSIRYEERYYVIFEAIPSTGDEKSVSGFVAIDDIIFTEGPCSVLPVRATVQVNATIPTRIPFTTPSPNASNILPEFGCTFVNDSFCEWVNGEDNDIEWSIWHRDFLYSFPSVDHLGSDLGDFIFVRPAKLSGAEGVARLVSPRLLPTTEHCLTFWYHMYGADIETLNVYLKKAGSLGSPVWARQKNQGAGWKKATLNIDQSSDNLTIVFEAHVPYTGDAVIALDDFVLTRQPCPENSMNCDFEDPKLCGYISNQEHGGWQYQSGSQITPNSVPAVDHTFNSAYGHYVVLRGSSAQPFFHYKLTSPPFVSAGYMCVRFWYYMRADESAFISVNKKDDNVNYIVHLKGSQEISDRWQVTQRSFISTSSQTQLEFSAYTGLYLLNVVAVDDVQITKGFCGDEADCNMEKGDLCTWNNDPKDDFDWLIGQGRDGNSEDSGPDLDHTLRSNQGHYIYFDAGKENGNSTARIYSQTFEDSDEITDRCMHFWYNIQGYSAGSLNVYQQLGFGFSKIWTATKNQGEEWNYAKVPFVGNRGSHQLIIEGVVGVATKGTIAVDDIVISDSGCSVEPAQTDLGPEGTTLPPITPPIGWMPLEELLTCSFQYWSMLCNWTQSNNDDFEWTLGKLDETVSGTPYIPPFDPSEPFSDSYIYVESNSHQKANSKAVLTSAADRYYTTNVYCVQFDYYMFGSDAGNLTLLVETDNSLDFGKGDVNFTHWKRVGTQEDRWLKAITTLKLHDEYVMKLHLEASLGFDGVIAVSTFVVKLGECPTASVCEFDNELLCQWVDGLYPLMWQRGSGMSTSFNGPPIDHTTLTSEGQYQFVKNKDGYSGDAKGRFISPVINEDYGTHCFKFWYYMGLAGSGSLGVLIKSLAQQSESEYIWARPGDSSPRWHLAQVPIVMRNGYEVVFEATFDGKNNNDVVAIDDLQLVPSSCDLPASCSFDDGPCGYMNDIIDDDFDWLLGVGRTQDREAISGPLMDALGNARGLYMYVDMTRTINIGDKSKAYLRSDLVFGNPIDQQYCLEFSYISLGSAKSDLTVYLNTLNGNYTQDTFHHLWVSGNQPVQKWTQFTVPFNCATDFEIVFAASQQQFTRNAFIGIDEIHLTKNPTCQEITPPKNQTRPEASQYFCDFEKGNFCNWEQDSKADITWRIDQGNQLDQYLPSFDHTKQNYKGHFITTESTYHQPSGYYSHLLSPEVNVTGPICFKFWYQMSGFEDRLEILLEPYERPAEILWTRSHSPSKVWTYEQIFINNVHSSKIGIRVYRAGDYHSYTSVDDIEILLESCPPRKMCTFDGDDYCDFDGGIKDDFAWNLTARPISNNDEFPTDHTTQTKDDGRYAYLNTNGRSKNQVASLISPMYPPVNGACIKFWFYTSTQFSEFWVHLVNIDSVKLGEYFEGRLAKGWNSAAVPLQPVSYWQVIFQGFVASNTEVAVALDDIEISFNDSCTVAEYCDFEKDDCLWHNGASTNAHDQMWVRKAADDSWSYVNGPKIDHTNFLPTGYFLIFDNYYNYEAELFSNVLTTEYQCFSFWYHVDRTDCELEVWYYGSSNDQDGVRLVTITPAVSHSWLSAIVPLKSNNFYGVNVNFMVKIVGKFGDGQNSLALDDLMFEKALCEDTQSNKFTCLLGNQTILQTQVCDYKIDCLWDTTDEMYCGTCDFENTSCGYMDTSGRSTVEWKVTRADEAALKKANAPLDRTSSKTGYYLWTEAVPGNSGMQLSKTRSPLIQYASSTCHLTLWIYKSPGRVYSGPQSPDLKVNIITSHGHMDYTVYESGEVRDRIWTKVLVYIGRVSQPFSIEFDTTVLSKEGFIAVDDVKLSLCEFQMTSLPCSDKQFACVSQNGCVPKNRICDFTADCDDSSDELDCAMSHMGCDFERSNCFWEDIDYAEWEPATGSNSGPDRDHTLGTPEGVFLKAQYLWHDDKPKSQKLGGLVFLPSQSCTMRFYYYLMNNYGHKATELKVSTRQYLNGEEKVYMTRDRNSGEYFLREEVTFNETKSFEVFFEAYVGYTFDVLALDDITFDGDCHLDSDPLPVGSTREPDFCAEDQFQCKSSKNAPCIKLDQVCDFNVDCQDKTDEQDCGACSFENGRCGWEDASSGMYRWERHQAKEFTSSKGNIPTEDHNTLTTDGWFLVLTRNMAGDSFASASFLESPMYGPTAPSCTLSFWYHASGSAGTLKLSIQSRDRNTVRPIATLPDNENVSWRSFVIVLGEMGMGYQLVFEANINESEKAMSAVGIAIDDVTFSGCSLRDSLSNVKFHNLTCTFENGLCAWYQDIVNDDINWKVGSGATPTPGTGPESDHTSGKGDYLYVEYNNDNMYGSLAMLVSQIMPATTGLCLRFWYHMFGEHVGSLRVVVVSAAGKNSTVIWTQTGSQGNLWRGAMASIVSKEPYQVIIYGEVGNGQKSAIAIDDITIVTGQCRQMKNAECSFELGTCGWKNKTPQFGKWRLVTSNDMPWFMPTDHTSNSPEGHYMYAELGSDKNANYSELQSEPFRSGREGSCFHFWYTVGDADDDSYKLTVTIKPYPNDGHFVVKNDFVNTEEAWQYGHLGIDANENFQISVAASYIPGIEPFIVVDDFRISNTSCLDYGSCDFESDWCGWTPKNSDIDWLRNSGSTVSEYTGPSADHTRGSQGNTWGYYAFVDASSGRSGDRAVMRSPVLRSGTLVCFTVWYHMRGKDTGKLAIYTSDTKLQRVEVFSTEGDQGGSWHPVFIEIHNLRGNYWLEIEATLSGGATGDIAVDDLLVEPDECKESHVIITTPLPTTTPPPKCLPNQKSCGSGQSVCIPRFMWCDGAKDCPKGEDESDCENQHQCADDQFPCFDVENKCISADKICDGKPDCEDDSFDESICDAGCFNGFCSNGGICSNKTTEKGGLKPVCSCASGTTGYRCQTFVATSAPDVATASNGWIAGVVILVVIILLGIAFLVQKRCFGRFNFRRDGDQNPIMMENPTYEYPTNQNIQLTDIREESHDESLTEQGSPKPEDQVDDGVVNPLYEEKSAEKSAVTNST